MDNLSTLPEKTPQNALKCIFVFFNLKMVNILLSVLLLCVYLHR